MTRQNSLPLIWFHIPRLPGPITCLPTFNLPWPFIVILSLTLPNLYPKLIITITCLHSFIAPTPHTQGPLSKFVPCSLSVLFRRNGVLIPQPIILILVHKRTNQWVLQRRWRGQKWAVAKTEPNWPGREKSWKHSPTLSLKSYPMWNNWMRNRQVVTSPMGLRL